MTFKSSPRPSDLRRNAGTPEPRNAHETETSRRWRGWVYAVACLVLLNVVGGAPAAAAAANVSAYPPLFSTREVRSANLAPFRRWTGLLDRYFAEIDVPDGTCEETTFNKCDSSYWVRFLDNLRGANPMIQLRQIDRYMNEVRYVTDSRNYNLPDYWATPRQFLERGGDCEDYAIAKYMSLRALGWEKENLRIVVVQDLNLRIAHAVLVAYHDGKAWVLDNKLKQILAADRILHYRPYYSINEDGWWLHKT